MNRFAVLTEWSSEIAKKIASKYKKHYKVDLENYIPQEGCNFFCKWNELMDVSFGKEWSYMKFDEVSIHEFVNAFLSGKENDDILLNALNRYELYEADVWISAAYTIQYLNANDKYKKFNLKDILKGEDETKRNIRELIYNLKKELADVTKEKIFCGNMLYYLTIGTGKELYYDLLNKDERLFLKSQSDVTRWSWQKILETERDNLYSQMITEKEYSEKQVQLKENLEGRKNILNDELLKLWRIPKVEDYLLYWKLTGGELVRRFLPIFHTDLIKMAADKKWLKELCKIDSVSWQIFLIEINKIGFLNSEIQFSSMKTDEVIYSFDIEHFEYIDFQKWSEYTAEKFKRLLEWEKQVIYVDGDKINKNRKMLVEAMVYLYMSSDPKVREEVLDTIQIIAKDFFQEIQTPQINCFKKIIKSYIDGQEDINDYLTEEMIKDLKKRVKNKKDGNIKEFKNIPDKIRLHNAEDSLTARYILLQKLMITIFADTYKLSESKEE